MASQDKDTESSPPWASQIGPWDAILEAVREQLPSLDSDSSLSDCGTEELFIFQRDQTALIPDLSEELTEDPARAWLAAVDGSPEVCREQALGTLGVVPAGFTPEPQRQWGTRTKASASLQGGDPGGPVESCEEASSLLRMPEDTPMWREGNQGAQSHPWGPQEEATFSPWEGNLKTEPPSAASRACWGADSIGRRALRKERRKMIEKDILYKVTRDARDSACSGQSQVEGASCTAPAAGLRPETPPEGSREGPPVLSLKELEEWDLDHILQSLAGREGDRGDRAPGATWWARHRQREKQPPCRELMDQLTLLCAAQSRGASAWKVPADAPQDTKPQEAGSRSAPMEPGFQAELGLTLAKGTHPRSPAEPPTIFIDLRPSSHQTSGPWKGTRSGDSPALQWSPWPQEEQRHGQVGVRPVWFLLCHRDCTRKSQLLQQLREFRKGTAQPNLPTAAGPGSQKAQIPEDPATSRTKRKHMYHRGLRSRAPRPHAQGAVPGSRETLVPPLGQL
uniref:Dynein axonemal assembly factor 8 n=1 Tax=Canis lupus familiaris TaxID=9615 RepID=A0A8C0SG77_CANLF